LKEAKDKTAAAYFSLVIFIISLSWWYFC